MNSSDVWPYNSDNPIVDLVDGAIADLDCGYDDAGDVAHGICMTLRAFGYFTPEQIDAWSVTPIPRARREMLEYAMVKAQNRRPDDKWPVPVPGQTENLGY